MAVTIKLDLLVVPTYSVMTMGVADASTYPTSPPGVANPLLFITVPGYGEVSLVFHTEELNLITTTDLGITVAGEEQTIPDGIYYLRYSVEPAATTFVEKSIIRVDYLQEKFDKAFMGLDFMECDRAIKTQAMVHLNTIYLLIQGSIAAANECATTEALKLYNTADKMLNQFLSNKCGCSGNNYLNH